MNIVEVRQGSKEWHALRARHFTASEAPAMIGISKYKTRSELLREKATGSTPDIDDATQERFDDGHIAEAKARPIVEARLETELFPATATLDVDGLPLLASYDGVSMDESTVWENKLRNAHNELNVQAVIDGQHWPQLEQQMLIVGVNKIYFTASDGTEEGTPGCWYASQAERRAQLLAGWRQFADDLKNYQHVEETPAAVGRAPETLPALRIEVTGMVTNSNLDQFKAHALSVIGGIKTDLQTDDDFANAEKTVKWCGEVEERLDAAKQHALSQTATIDDLFRAIDEIKNEARTKRLELDRLVKSRKESIRAEIVQQAKNALTEHVATLNQRLGKPYMPFQVADRFAAAVKGLKTIASLRNAVSTELANAKIEASGIADKIEINLNTLRELAQHHTFLFHDTAQIVLKQNDDLTALVKTRIADHTAAEHQRLEAERARIRHEEQAKAATPTTAAPIPPTSSSVVPAPSATVTPIEKQAKEIVGIIDEYLATLNVAPRKKVEIRQHVAAFLEFWTNRNAVRKQAASRSTFPKARGLNSH